jgi:hypothetical protein
VTQTGQEINFLPPAQYQIPLQREDGRDGREVLDYIKKKDIEKGGKDK